MISTAVYETLRSLVTPQTLWDFTYIQIVEKLQAHFNLTPNEIVERLNFNKRVQRNDKFMADFVADLHKLSKFCNFTELNNTLRDRIVCSVADEVLQKKLFAEPNLTFNWAFDLAVAAETAWKNVQFVDRKYDLCSWYECKRSDCKRNGKQHDGEKCKFKEAICHYYNCLLYTSRCV